MNSFQLFGQRVKSDIQFQYNIFKAVVDWIVMLYLFVPALIAGIIIYRSWWVQLPEWGSMISFHLVCFIAFLIAFLSKYRTFVREADGVFLNTHKTLLINMKKWAYAHSLLKTIFKMTFFIAIILPFLLHNDHLSIIEIISILVFYTSFSFFSMSLNSISFTKLEGWLKKILEVLFVIALIICNQVLFVHISIMPIASFIVSFLFIVWSVISYYPKLSSIVYFQDEFTQENKEHLRLINLIFTLSKDVEKPKIIKRKKPLLYRKSGRIFKKRTPQKGFMELFIKIILRNFEYLFGYFQLTGATIIAIIVVPPVFLKVFILIGFTFFLFSWLNNLWNRVILSHPISKQYEKRTDFKKARQKTGFYLSIPALIVVLIVLRINV